MPFKKRLLGMQADHVHVLHCGELALDMQLHCCAPKLKEQSKPKLFMLLVRVSKRGIYEDIVMFKKNITRITHLLHEQARWVGIFGLHEIQKHCPFLPTTLDHLDSFK